MLRRALPEAAYNFTSSISFTEVLIYFLPAAEVAETARQSADRVGRTSRINMPDTSPKNSAILHNDPAGDNENAPSAHFEITFENRRSGSRLGH